MSSIKGKNRKPFKPDQKNPPTFGGRYGGGSAINNIPFPTTPPAPTSLPGQSVAPGSINLPTGHYSWTEGRTPESVWWSHGEMGNTVPWIQALLQNMNAGGSLAQGYSDVLGQIIKALQNDPEANINPDMVMSLFNNLLSYNTTQEQREYDYKMLNESRQYNNPTNELARYMGAGISRDAALQMLSGSAGNIGSGGGSAASVQGPAAGAGAAALNSSNAHDNLVNQVFNGIQMIANLVGQGFGVAESVEQIKGMQMQNTFTQGQLSAYQSVNEVTEFLHNAQVSGLLEPSTMDNFRNAEDVFKWILDNKDNEQLAPLMQSGAINRTFGSTFGREMFNNHWQQQNRSRTDGEILDGYIRGMHLQNDIAALQPQMISAEIENLNYQNLNLDAQSLYYFQNMQESSARIQLMNKQGKFVDLQTKNLNLEYQINEAGFPMMKQNRIDELTLQAEKWNALFARDGYNFQIKGADGLQHTPFENEILTWLGQGSNAADVLYLKQLYNNAVGSFATKYPNLYKLCTVFDQFGLFRYVSSGAVDFFNTTVDRNTNLVKEVL